MKDEPPSDIELTMREEGWIPARELIDMPSPAISALRLLQSDCWDQFVNNIATSPALRFFDVEQAEFSHAATWSELAESVGQRSYDSAWRVPPELPDDIKVLCREMRRAADPSPDDTMQLLAPVFSAPAERPDVYLEDHGEVALIVHCAHERVRRYFGPSNGDESKRMRTWLLTRGLRAEMDIYDNHIMIIYRPS